MGESKLFFGDKFRTVCRYVTGMLLGLTGLLAVAYYNKLPERKGWLNSGPEILSSLKLGGKLSHFIFRTRK
mgnify:CR=1 FL=1